MVSLPIPTDPIVIRSFIMHDAFLKKPVFEGYKDLCKIIPDFDYPEYEFWYYRFVAGNPDMNYDRSADPKPLKLQELRVDALRKILEKVDVKHRFKIQKLSKIMLLVVNQLETAHNTIDIDCYKNYVTVYVKVGNSSWGLQYSSMLNGCEAHRNRRSEKIVGSDFMEIALHDLGFILRPTKIRLENFEICSHDSKDMNRIVDLLVSISKKATSEFHVKSAKIEIREPNLALSVLSAMKPGVMEKLKIGIFYEYEREYTKTLIDMNRIKDMEQFTRAKTVDLTEFGFIQSTDLAFFSGFEHFDVRVKSMESEDLIRLRDDLSKPDNNIFQSCSIKPDVPFMDVFELTRGLGKHVRHKWVHIVESSIANSEKILQFFVQRDNIDIHKTEPTPDGYHSTSDDSGSDLERDWNSSEDDW